MGNRGFQYLHPDDADAVVFIMGDLSSEENGEEVLECRMMCRDGSFKWIELSGKNLIHDPDIAGVLVTLHDITERKKGRKPCETVKPALKFCIMPHSEVLPFMIMAKLLSVTRGYQKLPAIL